jgi:hypothetical protein
MLNRQMALINLSATDPSALSRDWAFEMASPATAQAIGPWDISQAERVVEVQVRERHDCLIISFRGRRFGHFAIQKSSHRRTRIQAVGLTDQSGGKKEAKDENQAQQNSSLPCETGFKGVFHPQNCFNLIQAAKGE